MPSRGRFTSTSIREPFWVASTRSSSTASRVGPRFSISMRTCYASDANLDGPVEGRQVQVGRAVDRESLLVPDDLTLGIHADDAADNGAQANATIPPGAADFIRH